MHVLYFDNKNDTVNPESDTVNDTVKAYNGTVFSLIKQNPEIKADDLSKQLNLSLSTVKRKIKVLKEQGRIKRNGSDKTGFWEIVE
jgi:predicted HTH transcriptional regulator